MLDFRVEIMADYKKRQKGHWNQGKEYKGSRKAKQREHDKKEIEYQIESENVDFKEKYAAKCTPNHKARLEYRISWYEYILDKYKSRGISWDGLASSFRSSLRKLREKYAEKYGKK